MSKTTLIYIALLLVLCAGSFWLGTRQSEVVESVETVVKIDTVYIDTPAPPVEVEPMQSVTTTLPLANYKKLETQILDSLIAAGYERKDVEDILPSILPDSVDTSLPMLKYKFEEAGVYDIGITAPPYATLDYVKIFNTTTTTTTTLQSPIKHWSVTANLNSFTCQGLTDISAGVGIEYSLDKWRFGGGYQIFMNGNSGVNFRIEYKILNF